MPSELPLVSAIMPTRGRAGWAADAVRMFEAQTYPAKELVIVDDLMEPSFASAPSGAVYQRAPRFPIGAKRNLANSLASGAIICHWDSDDIYTVDRIESQVQQLLTSGAEMVGYHTMEFVEADGLLRRFEYRSKSSAFCIGVSQMYWRDSWERSPFQAIDVGEDSAFLVGRKCVAYPSAGRITARIHHGNTSDKREHLHLTDQWRLL